MLMILKKFSSKADSVGTYSLEYLNPVVKAVGSNAGFITCEFSSAKPLRIEFKVANIGRIHFLSCSTSRNLKHLKIE